jgi:Fe2+ or Zn2+ uptake regulation protein
LPDKLEKKLKAQAKKKGFKGKKADAYVYGIMRKTGWKPKKEKT